jgi:hypothetical protein
MRKSTRKLVLYLTRLAARRTFKYRQSMKFLRLLLKRARVTVGGSGQAETRAGARVRLRMTVDLRLPRPRFLRWHSLPSLRLLPLPEDLSHE